MEQVAAGSYNHQDCPETEVGGPREEGVEVTQTYGDLKRESGTRVALNRRPGVVVVVVGGGVPPRLRPWCSNRW